MYTPLDMWRDTLLERLQEMGDEPNYQRLAAEVLGIRGAPAQLARRLVAQALVVEDRRDLWRRAGDRICRKAPASPGVYILQDRRGCPLYVGKAVNLRRRLRAHFTDRRWRALKPEMSRVVEAEWEVVGSELEALVREATLIHELQPLVNVQVSRPTLETRAIPGSLVRDVILILPSSRSDSVELVAARADGGSMMHGTRRFDVDMTIVASQLRCFFRPTIGGRSERDGHRLAPLVFSWLAGRGTNTTRLDPHDMRSDAELGLRLEALLQDKDLFSERLILRST
jgi:predicted GIY-YIG superfamily endonuclease